MFQLNGEIKKKKLYNYLLKMSLLDIYDFY